MASGGVLWPRLVLWLLLVVSKWPFVLSYYLNGYSTAELPPPSSLQASCVGNTLPLPIGMELKINRGNWRETTWCDGRHGPAACKQWDSGLLLAFQKLVLIEQLISQVFPGLWLREVPCFSVVKGRLPGGSLFPQNSRVASFHTSRGNNLPSDRLIAVWVVTKKESILLAVCLAKWNRFLKLYQNVIIPGFKNMPSGCEEDPQIPQVKSPVRVPQGAAGSLRGGRAPKGLHQTSSWSLNCLFFFF